MKVTIRSIVSEKELDNLFNYMRWRHSMSDFNARLFYISGVNLRVDSLHIYYANDGDFFVSVDFDGEDLYYRDR